MPQRITIAAVSLALVALVFTSSVHAVDATAAKTPAAVPTPVEMTKDQAQRLASQQIVMAHARLAVEKEDAVFAAMLAHAALELHLDLTTHDLAVEDVAPGRYAFKVKAAPTAVTPKQGDAK
jgi:hypothetical protein